MTNMEARFLLPAMPARNPQRRPVELLAVGRRVPTRETPTVPGRSFGRETVLVEPFKDTIFLSSLLTWRRQRAQNHRFNSEGVLP